MSSTSMPWPILEQLIPLYVNIRKYSETGNKYCLGKRLTNNKKESEHKICPFCKEKIKGSSGRLNFIWGTRDLWGKYYENYTILAW